MAPRCLLHDVDQTHALVVHFPVSLSLTSFRGLGQLIRFRARMRDRVAGYPPTAAIVLARWCRDRRAVNGILIEGSPSGEMHDAIVRLVDGLSGTPLLRCVLSFAGHPLWLAM